MNPNIMEQAGFTREVNLVRSRKCPFCGYEIKMENFRDALSKKEYQISGLCQECQDKTFGRD